MSTLGETEEILCEILLPSHALIEEHQVWLPASLQETEPKLEKRWKLKWEMVKPKVKVENKLGYVGLRIDWV